MRLSRRWQHITALAGLSAVGSLFVLWGVIHGGFLHSAPELEYDTAGAVWTNAWVAHAIAHFQNPFFSPNLMHPYGLNLLANAYNVGFSALFAPVTWLLNPVASLNAQMFLIPVANTVVMGLCLRRWVRSPWLTVAGGLMWGFSPFVISSMAKGWTNVAFLVMPPLVAWLLAELLSGTGWSPRRVGLTLATVVTLQFFIDSELLVVTLTGTAVALVVVLIQRRRQWAQDWPRYLRAAAWSVVPTTILLVGPVAYGMFGPHPATNFVRPESTFRLFVSPLWGIVATPANPTLPPNLLFRVTANPSYLGVGMVAVVAIGLLLLRLPAVTRPFVVVGLFGAWVSVGYGPWWSPFSIIERLPVIHNLTVTRFIMLTWFAAIVVVVYVAQRAVEWAHRRPATRKVGVWVGAVTVLVAFAPPLAAVATRVPLSASSTFGDKALPWVLGHRGPHVVMGFPFPVATREMLQQAKLDNFSFVMPGGEWPQVYDAPEPANTVNELMRRAGYDQLFYAPTSAQINQLDVWLRRWHVTDVIVPRTYVPAYAAVYASPKQFVAIMTEALGAPQVVEGEWVWTHVHPTVPVVVMSQQRWAHCADVTAARVEHVPRCVLHTLALHR